MEREQNRSRTQQQDDPIEERLLDQGEEGRQSVIDAASDAFEQDQRDPNHPSRRERAHGVEDPSHSVGSTRQGPGE
jgi:hypothetical protein